MAFTLYDKLWDLHEVAQREDGTYLLYIDRHLIHEVTSPQAFEGLKLAGRKPWRISANIATPDHNVPTTDRVKGIDGINDEVAKLQVVTLDNNCKEHEILQFDIYDKRQGIVHVVGPEQGLTLPGMTIVCGGFSYLYTRSSCNIINGYRNLRSRTCFGYSMLENF